MSLERQRRGAAKSSSVRPVLLLIAASVSSSARVRPVSIRESMEGEILNSSAASSKDKGTPCRHLRSGESRLAIDAQCCTPCKFFQEATPHSMPLNLHSWV